MAHADDLTGKVFGKLRVVGRGRGMYGRPSWVCVCECGKSTEVGRGNLRSGSTTSCGCVRRSALADRTRTHGLSSTGAYASWSKMMQRCYDSRHPYFHAYGAAGIVVTASWHSFECFYKDMGERPEGCTLERKNSALGYSRDNCRWATRKEQANNTKRNKLLRYKGRVYTLAALAESVNILPHTLAKRLQRMSVRQAVTLPRYGRTPK